MAGWYGLLPFFFHWGAVPVIAFPWYYREYVLGRRA